MNYDTVLPERILRRYRRRRFRMPHWVRQTLAASAFTLSGCALICVLALIKPPTLRQRQEKLHDQEIIHQAIYGISTTPPQVVASIDYRPHGWNANGEAIGKAGVIGEAPRATLVKLPNNWNNVCTP